jgi:hypothetical protein
MKNIFIIFSFLILPLLSNAQVEFNGIRVGESLEITKKNLVEKGFTQKLTQGNLISWEGQINARPCKIYTVSTPKSKLVWKLLVIPETHTSWSSTKAAVNKYVEILSKKYGAPSNQYFYFKTPYEEGDGHEMLALKTDNLVCMYSWDIPGGSILLDISSVVYQEAQIHISYEDAEVTKINLEEKSKIDQNTF